MHKLLALLGAVSLTSLGGATVVSCGEKKDSLADNHLAKIIKETKLGEITNTDKSTIWKEIQTKNKDLKGLEEKDVEITVEEGDSPEKATVTVAKGSEEKYTGSVDVTFTVKAGETPKPDPEPDPEPVSKPGGDEKKLDKTYTSFKIGTLNN